MFSYDSLTPHSSPLPTTSPSCCFSCTDRQILWLNAGLLIVHSLALSSCLLRLRAQTFR
ncbi:hypothetical protein LINPERHAP2_LOCUS42446, partial [Linum perenne]